MRGSRGDSNAESARSVGDLMSSHQRRSGSRRLAGAARTGQLATGLGLAITLVWGVAACQSGPVRAFQGARHYAVGSDALEHGDGDRAIFELRRAAELVPHASEIQNHLGLAYLSKGEIDQARTAFEVALELDCDNQAAQSNLARLEDRSRVIPEGSRVTTERAQERPGFSTAEGNRSETDGG